MSGTKANNRENNNNVRTKGQDIIKSYCESNICVDIKPHGNEIYD